MRKRKLLTTIMFSAWGLLAILVVSGLGTQPPVSAAIANDPNAVPADAVGSYTVNGEFHWIVPNGEVKIVDFSGLTRDEIFEKIKMTPEDEAKIVHQIPPAPEITIDGIVYKSKDINLFDGQQLGFTTGEDGRLYAFTTEKGLQGFRESQQTAKSAPPSDGVLSIDSQYSHYFADWYLSGSVINCHYTISLATMPPGWDNVISSLEVNTSCYATRLYDGANFSGDFFEALAGTTYNVLTFQGWNDRASSTLHY